MVPLLSERGGTNSCMQNPFNPNSGYKKKPKQYSGPSTRQWPRYKISEVPSLKGVMSNGGSELEVINISRGGALLESDMRMRPGTKVLLRVVTIEGVIQIAGHVLRSSISSLKGAPRYQSAVEFESPLHILDDLSESKDDSSQPSERQSASSGGLGAGSEYEGSMQDFDRSSILEVTACEARDAGLVEMLKLNDW